MFDSTQVGQIPGGAAAVAGYVNGMYQTYPSLVGKFPKAHVLSIAVSSHADAVCLDVERGDATNEVAPGWLKRQQALGVKKPWVYTSVSNAMALQRTLTAAGIPRDQYILWTAHYSGHPHLCDHTCGFGPVQADATQWWDKAYGRVLDISLVRDGIWTPPPTPAPQPDVHDPEAHGESKGDAPFTRAVWPRPLPDWFWYWAAWKKGMLSERPLGIPARIPMWAWARYALL